MLRSMYSGVSGMKNFQVKLDVIGNNISNVNTIGFKKSSIQFQDLLSQTVSTSGANPMQVGLGSGTASLNRWIGPVLLHNITKAVDAEVTAWRSYLHRIPLCIQHIISLGCCHEPFRIQSEAAGASQVAFSTRF